ncbi:uncharacterized protein [Triticum aestivum]|uniref:uncharacterized protein n=1 Tax=Triticum aestivum TaxID=4565 RepID=UPI001D0160DE|nr:uncharacterized protein LOC123191501 [Triticum aestivum]
MAFGGCRARQGINLHVAVVQDVGAGTRPCTSYVQLFNHTLQIWRLKIRPRLAYPANKLHLANKLRPLSPQLSFEQQVFFSFLKLDRRRRRRRSASVRLAAIPLTVPDCFQSLTRCTSVLASIDSSNWVQGDGDTRIRSGSNLPWILSLVADCVPRGHLFTLMEEVTTPSSSESCRMPLSQLAKKHLFEPDTSELANPVITKLGVPHGHPELGPRGWTAGPSFSARCYQPPAPGPRLDEASTLGTHMISKGLGWENHEVEYAPMPLGYLEWGTNVLKKYHTHLKGSEEGVDYVYGAIYCSLGDYSVSPSLLRSLLERWDPNTNTFLFSSGERTVTLLDMHQIAGLPLDGEPYEEYVPLADELDPSTLLYPNFLPRLLKIWTKLAVGGKVGFKEWCDFFHNSGVNSFATESLEDQCVYTAAFLAIWLCRYVVVGGGPYIRPGVLVMAAWISLGRRISLGPPALCSLYYSLRRICTHPIGPSFIHRIWPVHYLAGWMGVYLKKPYGNRARTPNFPSSRILAVQPNMVNTMFKTPRHFTPKEAHAFLDDYKNIAWNPHSLTMEGVFKPKRAFLISIRRGMLPWRRGTITADVCIAEPYHPDRVARQFRLDQVVPFSPLASLYTQDEIGIAYAFWSHLLSLAPEEFHYFPDDDRVGNTSIAWANWWKKFLKPFADILDHLCNGNMTGKTPYDVRIKNKRALQHNIRPRPLSDKDFMVVRRVPIEHRDQHVQSLEKAETPITDQWRLVLYNYLNDVVAAQPVKSKELRRGNVLKQNALAGSSSAHPLSADNDISDTAPSASGKRHRQSTAPHVEQEERLPSKRKLDFGQESNFSEPTTLDGPSLDVELSNFVSEEDFGHVLMGEKDHGLGDLFNLSAIIEDLSAVEKKCTEMEAREAELKAQFEEVTATLHRLKLEMEQRRQAHDAHKSEQEKLVKSVQDTNAGKRARLAEFKQKTADLKTEASQLLNSLQNWRAL